MRLHNFCVKRRLPILATRFNPPSEAAVDIDGRLIDEAWRNGAEPDIEWRRFGQGNCIRQNIVHKIKEEGLYHSRNFSGRRGNN